MCSYGQRVHGITITIDNAHDLLAALSAIREC
jgi:hypothetical protein